MPSSIFHFIPHGSTRNGAWYGRSTALCAAILLVSAAFAGLFAAPARAETPVRIVALGDSLTAGYGLMAGDAYPAKLQAALRARGYNVTIANAGVSGDTSAQGLARVDWSVPQGTQAVIVEFGANDMFRGVPPATVKHNLEAIIQKLKARHIEVMLAGMYATRSLGKEYYAAFDAIYRDLAHKYGLVFMPFFLEGVVGVHNLNQPDGIHPTAAGIDLVVKKSLPSVEALIQRVRGRKSS
jgi:acyl-CoA thioesterase-1